MISNGGRFMAIDELYGSVSPWYGTAKSTLGEDGLSGWSDSDSEFEAGIVPQL